MSHALLYDWSNPGSRRPDAARRRTTTSACGIGSPTSLRDARRSRMALHVFPDCCLREGVEAEAFAFAIQAYRREFLLPKNRDDPVHGTPPGPRGYILGT